MLSTLYSILAILICMALLSLDLWALWIAWYSCKNRLRLSSSFTNSLHRHKSLSGNRAFISSGKFASILSNSSFGTELLNTSTDKYFSGKMTGQCNLAIIMNSTQIGYYFHLYLYFWMLPSANVQTDPPRFLKCQLKTPCLMQQCLFACILTDLLLSYNFPFAVLRNFWFDLFSRRSFLSLSVSLFDQCKSLIFIKRTRKANGCLSISGMMIPLISYLSSWSRQKKQASLVGKISSRTFSSTLSLSATDRSVVEWNPGTMLELDGTSG